MRHDLGLENHIEAVDGAFGMRTDHVDVVRNRSPTDRASWNFRDRTCSGWPGCAGRGTSGWATAPYPAMVDPALISRLKKLEEAPTVMAGLPANNLASMVSSASLVSPTTFMPIHCSNRCRLVPMKSASSETAVCLRQCAACRQHPGRQPCPHDHGLCHRPQPTRLVGRR